MKLALCPPRRLGFFVAIAVAIAAACGSSSAHAETANSFVVHDVTVFDGHARRLHADVIVRDGLIAAVGEHLALPASAPVIDGRGKTLLPGLIDAHVHSWGESRREALRFGVTSELDMFTDPRVLPDAKAQRAKVARFEQADLWSAGVLATVPGGHGTEYGIKIPTLTKADEAEGFVADRVKDGSDYLKIVLEDGSAYGKQIATLDATTVKALAASGHAHGLMSLAHVATEQEAQEAFDAHVDGLAHVFGDRALDAKADAAFLKAAHGHFVVATLSVLDGLSRGDSAKILLADGRIAPWLDGTQRQMLGSAFPPGWTQAHFITDALHNVGLLHAAGVPVLAGTDAGNPGTAHGASLHGELALLVRAGLTPTQALEAATSLPAQIFKLADRGRIAAGLRADLLLVDGDPTVDITATRAIVTIWMNGYAVDRGPRADAQSAVATSAEPAADANPLIADFEAGTPAARIGTGFSVTTDQLVGGKSSAELVWTAGGASSSKGCLNVHGQVDGGLPYAWSGALWMASATAMEPVDYSARKELVFKVRGAPRQGLAMIFSGPAANGRPAMLPFAITPEWTEVRLPLDQFAGAEAARLRGLAITVGLPAGPYSFDLDDVSIQ